jgi:chromosome segregation ATPase
MADLDCADSDGRSDGTGGLNSSYNQNCPASGLLAQQPDKLTMTTLAEFFAEYSHLLGDAINTKLADSQAAQDAAIQAQIATLTGADSNVNAFLDQLRTLLDSDSQSVGYQQGMNLFETIAQRVSELNAAIAATNGNVTAISNSVTQFGIDLASLLARVVALESATAVLRTDVDSAHAKADGITAAITAAAGGLTAYLAEFVAGLNGTARPGN